MAATESIPAVLQADFKTLGSVHDTIQDYITGIGESYIISHSDRTHYIITCHNKFCKFGIRAAVLKDSKVHITHYIPYSYSPITHTGFYQASSVSFLVNRHQAAVADNRDISLFQIQSTE